MAMDVQPRAPQHGTRRHHASDEVGHGRIAPLLATAKNGGITERSAARRLRFIRTLAACWRWPSVLLHACWLTAKETTPPAPLLPRARGIRPGRRPPVDNEWMRAYRPARAAP